MTAMRMSFLSGRGRLIRVVSLCSGRKSIGAGAGPRADASGTRTCPITTSTAAGTGHAGGGRPKCRRQAVLDNHLPRTRGKGRMRILVTGGTGYIGSHTCVVLAGRGHDLVLADNFSNSSPRVLERLARITGRPPAFRQVDLRDRDATLALLADGGFDAVVHFAALKAVGESCEKPLDYFHNNITGTIHLLQGMQAAGVKRLVFSSSATVYGDPAQVPVREDAPLGATNPYGRSKLVMEQLIADLCASDPS